MCSRKYPSKAFHLCSVGETVAACKSPFFVIHVGKIGLSGVIVGANSKSTFAPKTGYQPLFPSRGPVPGDLAGKFCSVVGACCLQRWRFFVRALWPRFGSILRTQTWTHVSISLLRLNIGVQMWTHFRAHFMDPNLVWQLEPKTHKNESVVPIFVTRSFTAARGPQPRLYQPTGGEQTLVNQFLVQKWTCFWVSARSYLSMLYLACCCTKRTYREYNYSKKGTQGQIIVCYKTLYLEVVAIALLPPPPLPPE